MKNFIQEKNIFKGIKDLLMSPDFPYYYNDHVSSKKDKSDYFFSHTLCDSTQPTSDFFNEIIPPILKRLDFKKLYRAKVNCYTQKHKLIPTRMHTDTPIKHMVALLSINNNNGYTLFEDGHRVLSRENQLILFKGDVKHCSVAQTDKNIRVNINLNLV
tara:strand:- start:151 stop:624 length:474 start_codon:yes stop_codon:yes gene_type:complete